MNIDKLRVRVAFAVVMWCVLSVPQAQEDGVSEAPLVAIGAYPKPSFSPSRDEQFRIPLLVPHPEALSEIKIEIRTADDDPIRTLTVTDIPADTTTYTVSWDGRDTTGKIIPDEVYYPVLRVEEKLGKTTVIDPRAHSGGEEVYDFEKTIRPGVIEYRLPLASRVLIRGGIKNGPMLRTIVDWEPRAAGFHAERWNGRDLDDVIAIEREPSVRYLIIGYRLSDKAIITYGNTQQTYRAYRERHDLPLKKASYENRVLERNGKVVRQEFHQPVLQQKSPRLEVSFLARETRKPVSKIEGFDEVLTKVNLNRLDEIYLDQERYEISFFVDNQFLAEEEQGFVPMTWRWSPARFGLDPGKHVLTVNVSGYNGQVGVKNIAFELLAPAEEAGSAVSDSDDPLNNAK
jgi:hypothetical protein